MRFHSLLMMLVIIASCDVALGQVSRVDERVIDCREAAITQGLHWIATQQAEDGSWRFDPQVDFANPGNDASRVKATAVSLLCFLSAGQTHKDGNHQRTVERGLQWMLKQQQVDGDLRGAQGDLTSHALATAVLCEARVMANDKRLAKPAQQALDYLQSTSDIKHGGWGARPQDPGNLSVTIWCLSALKSGHMAYLEVKPTTVKSAANFLERVKVTDKPQFGFTDATPNDTASAMGLCAAQWLGQQKLVASGVEFLTAKRDKASDCEFDYFAMLVLNQQFSAEANAWREQKRTHIIDQQVTKDEGQGSWFAAEDATAERSGRLYQTALRLMTLTSRAARLPPSRQSADDEFPL